MVLNICIFTSTRADYGLLKPLMTRILGTKGAALKIAVAGTHLLRQFGKTIDYIIEDGFMPSVVIAPDFQEDDVKGVIARDSSISEPLASFFSVEKVDFFVVLGDRAELLIACHAAVIAGIPIVHLHGGEVTEGAIDEKIRHAVTKLSNYHFTSTDIYRKRVIQLGEIEENVVTCGALGLEGMKDHDFVSKASISDYLDFDLSADYFVVVYHPETNSDQEYSSQLTKALGSFNEYHKVIICPNADLRNQQIVSHYEDLANHSENVVIVKSIPHLVYLSLLKGCRLLIGNSSSGIIEAPALGVSVLNIGERQRGRLKSTTIVDVPLDYKMIRSGILEILENEPDVSSMKLNSPYQIMESSKIILDSLFRVGMDANVNKKFNDLGGIL